MNKIIYSLVIGTFLFINIHADTIEQDNHAPFSLSQHLKIGTYIGNSFAYTLDGEDPDGDEFFFQLDDPTGLASQGVNCDFYHTNQLNCSISEDLSIPESSTCVMKDNYIQSSCATLQVAYHIIDDKGMQSLKHYNVTLYISNKENNTSGAFETDITKNPRAFLNEMQGKTRLSDYGNIANSNNIGASMLNSDMFADGDSQFGKQMNLSKDIINNKDMEGMQSDRLNETSEGVTALGNTATDPDFINQTYSEGIASLGYDSIGAPVNCVIERKNMQLEKYFICSADPMINIDQTLATKYYAIAGNEPAALSTCESMCRQTATCDPEQTENLVDFVRNRNFVDETVYSSIINNIKNIDTVDRIRVFIKNSSGVLQDSYDVNLTTEISTGDIYWDDSIIPSRRQIGNQLQMNVSFMGDSFYSSTITGNTFILLPKISYWASINNREVLKSYDASQLYTIVFSNNGTNYRCPLPRRTEQTYEDAVSCNSACVQQDECVMFTDSSYDAQTAEEIANYCKDTVVAGNRPLEELVENGECVLKDEYVIDNYNNPTHYYVRDFVQVDPYRPEIGFLSSADVLKKEKAVEIAYAFGDMINSGSDRGQKDEINKLNTNLFTDFDFHESTDMFKTLPVVSGASVANMDISILLKLNPSFFHKEKFKESVRSELTTDKERMIYDAYGDVLQRIPDEDGMQYWLQNTSNINDYESIKEAIFNGAINSDNTVGITIGILTVDVPDFIDENTTIRTEFKILDKKGEFRTAFVTGPAIDYTSKDNNYIIGDWEGGGTCYESSVSNCNSGLQRGIAKRDSAGCPINSSKLKCYYQPSNVTGATVSEIVLNEYLQKIGRMPEYDGFYYWINAIKDGMSINDFHNNFDSAVTANLQNLDEGSFLDTNVTDTSIQLNSMLQNYIYARGGSFNPATISFETGSLTSATPSDFMIVNPYVYNEQLKNNYMKLKSYFLTEPATGKPIDVAQDSALSENSSFNHTYHFLFAYVDKAPAMKDLTVKDFIDRVWDDYRNHIKKYFVWDYVTRSMATKKLTDSTTEWKNHLLINRYGSYFNTDSFSYLGESDLITTFYEDASIEKNDNVYIAKRGDNYIIKMNPLGQNYEYHENACPDNQQYDVSTGKCTQETSSTLTSEPICVSGTYNQNTGKCEGTTLGTISISEYKSSSSCLEIKKTLNVNINNIDDVLSFKIDNAQYDDFLMVKVNGHVAGIGPYPGDNILLSSWSPYGIVDVYNNGQATEYACEQNSRGYFTNNIDIKQYLSTGQNTIEVTLFVKGGGMMGVNFSINGSGVSCGNDECTQSATVVQSQTDPSCMAGYTLNTISGSCEKEETNITTSEPSCQNSSDLIDASGQCYEIIPLLGTYDKNGYYFAYLQKDGDNNIKFITPIVASSPIQCTQHPYKCEATQQVFYSQNSCENYCNQSCVEESQQSSLLPNSFYSQEECVNSCIKYEQKTLQSVRMRLVAKNDILTQSGNISIVKNSSTYGNGDFSNDLYYADGNIYLSQTNSGIDLGEFENGDSLQISYGTTSVNQNNIIGLARVNDSYIDGVQFGYVPSETLDSCVNMHAYYPNMGIYLQVDYNNDGIYDTDIKISETFLCHPSTIKSVIQNISFEGDKINYDFVLQDGSIVHQSKDIIVDNKGECYADANITNNIPLPQTYASSDYIPPATILQSNEINSTMRFARKTVLFSLGTVDRNMQTYYDFYSQNGSVEGLNNEININNNIPIPLYQGVHQSDDFDVMLKDTGFDSGINTAVGDYKLKVGFGFVPWNDCRNFDGFTTSLKYDYIPKTNCSSYGSLYHYSDYAKKCISQKFVDNQGNYYCPYGVLSGDNCEVNPTCIENWDEDPVDTSRCYKTTISSTEGTTKVCKPWWRIMRVYDCSGMVTDNAYNLIDNITSGPPRFVNVCTQQEKIYKSLTIDSDGNIVEGE
ncbi:hypothetical protein [Sulfurimonas sp. NW9]|uniref:hypothetical protein n=1 Tax=Sulfurimonas sp. NW9 TaxID=2922728 RepID=UPI003DA844E8